MINVLHLSDLHVGEHPGRRAALARIVTWIIANLSAATTLVAVTGDITHNGLPGEWSKASAELARLRVAGFVVVPVPGNHDCGMLGLTWRADRRAGFDRLWREVASQPLASRWPQVVLFGGWRFIALDSCEGNSDDWIPLARGELGKAQIARLEGELAELGPACVLLHHHVIDSNPTTQLDEAEGVAELLGRRALPLLLNGHRHKRAVHLGHKGIAATYDAGQTTEPVNGHYELNLHRLGPDGSVTTQAMRIPQKEAA